MSSSLPIGPRKYLPQCTLSGVAISKVAIKERVAGGGQRWTIEHPTHPFAGRMALGRADVCRLKGTEDEARASARRIWGAR